MTVFFTSDLHIGHRMVAGLRGFEDASAHDAAILDAWRDQVLKDDVVWVLGDVAMGAPAYALGLLASLPGRKRLVLGNHDGAHPMYRDAPRRHREYTEAFEWVTQSARTKVCGVEVVLSHFPYARDRHEVRHMQWRLRNEGTPLLHGHTHGPERLSFAAGSVPEVHVGLDAWGMRLVSDTDVHALLVGW